MTCCENGRSSRFPIEWNATAWRELPELLDESRKLPETAECFVQSRMRAIFQPSISPFTAIQYPLWKPRSGGGLDIPKSWQSSVGDRDLPDAHYISSYDKNYTLHYRYIHIK